MKRCILGLAAICGLVAGCTSWVPTVINNGVSYGVNAGRIISADRSLFNVLNDLNIKNTINNALLDEALLLNINADVYQGMVMLTGAVSNAEARQKVEDLARAVNGVRELYNDVQVTDEIWLKSLPKDLFIENMLATRMALAKGVSSVNYQLRTSNGVVYVLGISQSRAELDRVIALARATGARKIISHVFLTEHVALEIADTDVPAKEEVVPVMAVIEPAPLNTKTLEPKTKSEPKTTKKKPTPRPSSPRSSIP